jgi:hypothetical protein
MSVAERIRKLGFRRWYERQLIEAHGSLVTALLSVIMIAVCLDQFRWREAGFKPLIMLALIVAGIVLCYKTVVFYFSTLFRAEHFASQAVCNACKTYGVIEVLSSSPRDTEDADVGNGGNAFKVRCRKCRHDWTMSAMPSGEPKGKYL